VGSRFPCSSSHAPALTLCPSLPLLPRSAARTVGQLEMEVEAGAQLILHVGDISYANGREEVRSSLPSRSPCEWLLLLPVCVVSTEAQFPGFACPLRLLGEDVRTGQYFSSDAWCRLTPFAQIWDSFMESIEPFASRVPYMVRCVLASRQLRLHPACLVCIGSHPRLTARQEATLSLACTRLLGLRCCFKCGPCLEANPAHTNLLPINHS
jgi:hypothetical protein